MKKIFFRNFTLVELLLVIAIIAILASMLFPALVKAKKMTYRTSCMNKLKQIATATISYADEQNGTFPVYWDSLSGYLKIPESYTTAISNDEQTIQAFKKKLEILHCPEDTVFGYVEYDYWYCTSYAKNYHLAQDPLAPRIGRVKNPSGIIWTIDSTRKSFSNSTTLCPFTVGGNRHFNGWNASFVDGHAEWGTISKLKVGPGGNNIYPVQ